MKLDLVVMVLDCYCDKWFWDMHTSPVALICC